MALAPSTKDPKEVFKLFRNEANTLTPRITLVRPSVCFSAKTYSSPMALPIGLAYLAATLEKSHYAVNIIDAVGEGIDRIEVSKDGQFKTQGLSHSEVIQRIDANADIIGVSVMFSQEWPHIKCCINEIRKQFPNATIVIGGEHVTAITEFCLRDCPAVDFAIQGEAELSFLELVHSIRKNNSTPKIAGVAYLDREQFCLGSVPRRVVAIDDLPWPAWHLVNLEPYFQPNFTMGISRGRNIAMVATRGCPYQCTFCSSPAMWSTRYVMRSPKDVVDEIEFNIARYRVNSIDFYDLTAIVKKSWILAFIQELKRRQLRISWQLPSGTRSEVLDATVLSGVAETGLEFIVYAPESASPRVLKSIKKHLKISSLTQSIKIAKQKGLIVKVNFIIGFPEEKRSDVFKTLLYMWKLALLKVDDCNVSFFAPYPGSHLFRQLLNTGKISKLCDSYFNGLIVQFDFQVSTNFCRNIGATELLVYRVLGMALFYGLSLIRCPSRLYRFLTLLIGKNTQKLRLKSLFEQRVSDSIVRKLSVTPHSTSNRV